MTPHVLREAHRAGGDTVHVRGPRVISRVAYKRLAPVERHGYVAMTRDPELYARGTVRHPDHATIEVRGWHRVVMNTERGARAMRHIVFVD